MPTNVLERPAVANIASDTAVPKWKAVAALRRTSPADVRVPQTPLVAGLPVDVPITHQLAPSTVTIPAYPMGLTREEAIQRFKEDLARLLEAAPERIEVRYVGDGLQAQVVGLAPIYGVRFQQPGDQERFLRWALASHSPRLSDFGHRQAETHWDAAVTARAAAGASLKLHQNFNSEFYLGGSADHRVKVGTALAQGLDDTRMVGSDALTLGYHHNVWGGIDFRMTPEGKLDISNLEANVVTPEWRRYAKRIQEGDGGALLEGAAVVGAAAAGLYAVGSSWPTTQELNAPLSLKLYDDGKWRVSGAADGKLQLGQGQFDYTFKGAGVGVKQRVGPGVSVSQSLGYKHDQNYVAVGAGLQVERTSVSVLQGVSTKDGSSTGTQLSFGQGVALTDRMVGQVGVQAQLDGQGTPIKPVLNLGMQYQLNESWGFRVNSSISAPDFTSKPDVTTTMGVHVNL